MFKVTDIFFNKKVTGTLIYEAFVLEKNKLENNERIAVFMLNSNLQKPIHRNWLLEIPYNF